MTAWQLYRALHQQFEARNQGLVYSVHPDQQVLIEGCDCLAPLTGVSFGASLILKRSDPEAQPSPGKPWCGDARTISLGHPRGDTTVTDAEVAQTLAAASAESETVARGPEYEV